MESKSSSEETDRSDQGEGGGGGVKTYECVFCKRGFTTAQALGGHMNIHRKDKAKTRTSQSVSAKIDAKSCSYEPIQSFVPHYVVDPEVRGYYHNQELVVPSSSWVLRPQETHHEETDYLSSENPWNMSNDLEIVDENNKVKYGEEHEELDLELRLGYDP